MAQGPEAHPLAQQVKWSVLGVQETNSHPVRVAFSKKGTGGSAHHLCPRAFEGSSTEMPVGRGNPSPRLPHGWKAQPLQEFGDGTLSHSH